MPDEEFYIIDANVLIDYCESDLSVLKALSLKIGKVHVAFTTLKKVAELDEEACEEYEFTLITPTEEHVYQAAQDNLSVAFDDYICYLIAKNCGYILVTNDKKLRKICETDDVQVLWGLEIMLLLNQNGYLSVEEAMSIAEAIHLSNSAHISKSIIKEFKRKLQHG